MFSSEEGGGVGNKSAHCGNVRPRRLGLPGIDETSLSMAEEGVRAAYSDRKQRNIFKDLLQSCAVALAAVRPSAYK